MKRLFTCIVALAIMLMASLNTNAQTNIPLPNNSFENWSNGSGYSVTVWFIPLQVYSSYTYPTNWSYPSYPVNESITYSGMTVNVNTNLPLLKVSHETSSVADGSSALKMQTFMLSDIISSTVYSLAESNIDPQLTSMVIPTILSTGEIDLDQLLPILSTIMVNMSSIGQLMSTFANEDINDYIDGGVALNGLVPGRLTGQYKYTSATSGDNGGILMLGTKYNTTTHRRELVGGGYSISLTDVSTYTDFEILYRPLSEILPAYSYNEPDTIAILLFSSANNNRQQGSVLYLDNLQLWTAAPEVPGDTCDAVTNLAIDYVDTALASISWDYDSNPDHWEAEYGVQGFAHGSGDVVTTINNSIILSALQPDTYYDVYVRSICNDSLASDWSIISFKTDTLVPPVIPPVPDTCADVTGLTVDYVDTTHANISWTFDENPDHWEAEYGVQGFAHGSGNLVTTINNSIILSALQPDTYYDVYVRSVCNDSLASEWSFISFKTDTLVPPVIPPVPDTCANVTGLTVDYVDTTHANISWNFDENPDHWEVEYGEQGFTQGNGISQNANNTNITLSDLQPDTYYDVYVRSACEDDIFGDWAMISFKTDTLPITPDDTTGPEDPDYIQLFTNDIISIFPNPAHGNCTVQFHEQQPAKIQLYSIDGKLLQNIILNNETINLSLPYSGIFMLRCETEKGILTRKIVSF